MTDSPGSAASGALPGELDLLSGWLSGRAEGERLAARFAALADALPQGVAILTPHASVFANRQVPRLLGLPAAALTPAALAQLVPEPGQREALRWALGAAWQGAPGDLAAVPITAADGARRSLGIAIRHLPDEPEPSLLLVLDDAAPGSGEPHDPLRALGLHLAGLAGDLRALLSAYLEHLGSLAERSDLPADLREGLELYRSLTTESLGRLGRALEWGQRRPLEPTDLRAVAERAAAAVESGGLAPGVRLCLDLRPVPLVPGIADQLQVAVEHLLKNAAEALGTRGGTIRLGLGTRPGRVELTVADDGPGIPRSILPHVLEPFASTKSIVSGLGLGLAIVKDIAGRHGGEVSVESGATGTAVTLGLDPLVEAAPDGADRRPQRALIVDDNTRIRETYQALLGDEGWDVAWATSADEALRLAVSWEPDALLIDVQLPGRDGLALVEALALWHPHLLPRIALHTGYGDERRVRAAVERHGLLLVQKPCPFDRLARTLAELAARGPRPPGT